MRKGTLYTFLFLLSLVASITIQAREQVVKPLTTIIYDPTNFEDSSDLSLSTIYESTRILAKDTGMNTLMFLPSDAFTKESLDHYYEEIRGVVEREMRYVHDTLGILMNECTDTDGDGKKNVPKISILNVNVAKETIESLVNDGKLFEIKSTNKVIYRTKSYETIALLSDASRKIWNENSVKVDNAFNFQYLGSVLNLGLCKSKIELGLTQAANLPTQIIDKEIATSEVIIKQIAMSNMIKPTSGVLRISAKYNPKTEVFTLDNPKLVFGEAINYGILSSENDDLTFIRRYTNTENAKVISIPLIPFIHREKVENSLQLHGNLTKDALPVRIPEVINPVDGIPAIFFIRGIVLGHHGIEFDSMDVPFIVKRIKLYKWLASINVTLHLRFVDKKFTGEVNAMAKKYMDDFQTEINNIFTKLGL